MQLRRREKVLLGALAAAVLAALLLFTRHPDSAPVALGRGRPSPTLTPIPRIDLARLESPRPDARVGRRDLFGFGMDFGDEDAEDFPTAAATPLPVPTPALDPSAVAAFDSRLPPLNLKFIGSVENAKGVRVAVLLTDRNEVLTGQAGELVANRYRIARIGFESVDLEEVGTGQTRRIPLKGS